MNTTLFAINYTEELTGLYASDMFGKIKIVKKQKGYYIAETNQGNYTLTHEQNNIYRIKYQIFGFIPMSIGQLNNIKLYLEGNYIKINNDGTVDTVAIKVTPQHISKNWKARQGTYICTDSSNDITKVVAKVIDSLFVLNLYFESHDSFSLVLKIKNDTHGIIMSPSKKNRKILQIKDKMFQVGKFFYKKIN
jgi:hypothetical protein